MKSMLSKVAEKRGLPFLKAGMKVKLQYNKIKKYGVIINGNESLNLDIRYDGQD